MKSSIQRDGSALPDPRKVSLLLQSETEEAVTFSETTTRLLTDFGQFLTHDIIQTPDLAGSGPDPCDCVRTDVCDYVFPRGDPIIPWRCFFIVKSVGRIGRSGNVYLKIKFYKYRDVRVDHFGNNR